MGDDMSSIILTNQVCSSMTAISNIFIDNYMPRSNGEFVKVYLYLLRCTSDNQSVTLNTIADQLHHTEKDVNRALLYWEKEGLLQLEQDTAKQVSGISILPLPMNIPKPVAQTQSQTQHNPSQQESEAAAAYEAEVLTQTIPQKSSYTPKDLSHKIEEEGLSQIAFLADTYLGTPLNQTDLNTLFYFFDQLRFSPDLIEYLIEHCVSKGKKSMRYIETVAISWFEQGIDTVKKAKSDTKAYNKNYFSIMKAFGLSGRNPGHVEADFIKKWLEEYGFELDIILEACNRTITTIQQPSFPYTDSILNGWFKSKVHSLSDIKALDLQHQTKKSTQTNQSAQAPKKTTNAPNKFHNFEQRTYNYADLEQKFINKVNGITPESR